MPETPYTQFCNHLYQLTRDVRSFIVQDVSTAVDRICKDNPDADPTQYRVRHYPFIRILKWLYTFEKLNETRDYQGVGAGARAIFENYVDLRWLEKFPQDDSYQRFRAFPDVNRYMAADKVVSHKRKNPSSNLDATPHERFMKQMDASDPTENLVVRLWGINDKGKPSWPVHWTGVSSLRGRAERIGPDCEDAYVQIYPTLSALTHCGPTPEHGNLAWLEKQAAFGYFFAFKFALDAAILFAKLFDVHASIPHFDEKVAQLLRWTDEAFAQIPNGCGI
ncbi:MAG: DUF5677 domain-containing protein [Phycisphaeraceae bacterium]